MTEEGEGGGGEEQRGGKTWRGGPHEGDGGSWNGETRGFGRSGVGRENVTIRWKEEREGTLAGVCIAHIKEQKPASGAPRSGAKDGGEGSAIARAFACEAFEPAACGRARARGRVQAPEQASAKGPRPCRAKARE